MRLFFNHMVWKKREVDNLKQFEAARDDHDRGAYSVLYSVLAKNDHAVVRGWGTTRASRTSTRLNEKRHIQNSRM